MQGTPVSARTRRARARTQRDAAAPTRATSVNDGTVETAARTAPRRRTVTPPPGAAPAPAPARRRPRSPPPSQPLTQESPAPPAAKRPRSPTRSRAPAEAPAMPASEDLTQPDEAPAPPTVDEPMAEVPPPPPVRKGLDIVSLLLPRLQRKEIIACHQTCRLLRNAAVCPRAELPKQCGCRRMRDQTGSEADTEVKQ